MPNAVGKSAAIPITSPVLFISGPSTASAPAKRANGSTASLTLTWRSGRRQFLVGELLAQHQPAGDLGERRPDRLADEGHGPGGARVGLDHVELAAGDRVLDVDQADHPELERDLLGGLADLLEHLLAEAHRRDHAGRVAGVDPGLLDVLHHAGDEALARRRKRVDVDLDRVLQEAVEQQRVLLVGLALASR